jgi:heme exporter protein D
VIWGSWDAFWAMGGYGLYVWGSYAMVAAVLAVEIWLLKSRKRAAENEARRAGTRAGSPT